MEGLKGLNDSAGLIFPQNPHFSTLQHFLIKLLLFC